MSVFTKIVLVSMIIGIVVFGTIHVRGRSFKSYFAESNHAKIEHVAQVPTQSLEKIDETYSC